MSHTPTEEQWAQIEAELFAGRKIQAIKMFREITHCGLKEAKDALDIHERELRNISPEKFSGKQGAGCTAVVLLITIVGAALSLL